MHRPHAGPKERKGLGRARLQRALFGLDEVPPHLPARRAMNAEARDGPVPVAEKQVLRLKTLEAPSLERVVLHVAAAPLLLAVLLRVPRLRRQRREAPVRGEGTVHLGHVGIVETGAHDGGLQIIVAHDQGHPAQVTEGALMQPEEGLDALIPDALFVAVPRVTERQPKDPRAVPFAGRGLERRGAAEEVDLAFRARRTMIDADRAALRRRERADIPRDRGTAPGNTLAAFARRRRS